MSFSVFVDESGNTGPNLNEAAQPVFVHAALLVPAPKIEAARALAQEVQTELLPNSDELHAPRTKCAWFWNWAARRDAIVFGKNTKGDPHDVSGKVTSNQNTSTRQPFALSS